jgi:hypothetical protein
MSKRISFEGYCARIRKLPSFKGLPEIEFKSKAKKLYTKKYGKVEEEELTTIENEVGVWISKKEANEALTLFNTYKNNYHLESLSDLELLKKLVYCEIMVKRIEKLLNEKTNEVQAKALRTFNELLNQILNIRTNLGLIKDKAQGIFEYIELLKKKAKLWRQSNPNPYPYIPCAWCGKPLYIKLKDPHLYEAVKNPFFKGRILYNKELLNLIKQGKITVEEGAKILRTSPDYVKLLYDKEFGSSAVNPAINSSSV